MADSRTKNAIRNIFFGTLNKFVSLVLPFLTRTLVLYWLGAEYLGIGTLYSSILNFLSLTELGFGAAVVYMMYKPIAENDTNTICALLNFYKKMYRLIGIIVLGVGLIVVPFVSYLMNGEAPDGLNIYLLYCIYLFKSVISYFFYGYKESLLIAHQRTDVSSNVHSLLSFVVLVLQIVVLYFVRDFYVYSIIPIVGTILANGLIAVITSKRYPEYVPKGELDKSFTEGFWKKISGLFGSKLNATVIHSADAIVISAFLGLTITSKYGNYYYLMNTVCAFVSMIFSSMTAGIGNKIVTESIDENYKLFKNLSFVNAWLTIWFGAAFFCLYEPFMKIWVGEEMQLGIEFVIFIVCYYFMYQIQKTILTFKDAVGLWDKDQVRPYVSMSVNLLMNFILVRFMGIYGVVLSTIIAYLISLPWLNHILFKNLFTSVKPIVNLMSTLNYFVVTVIACAVTYVPCYFLGDSIIEFLIKGVICVIVPNLVFVLIYHRREEFGFFVAKVKSLIKR